MSEPWNGFPPLLRRGWGGLLKALAALIPMTLAAEAVIERTPQGVRYGTVTPKPAAKSVPTVFFFAGSAEQSLSEQRFIDCQKALGANVLGVSIDLPGHGEDQREGEPGSLQTWRHRIDKGEDIINATTQRATAVLDHLVASGQTDPARVAVFGTSRGGFMAFHWAAADKRVRHIAAFAPVTQLPILTEFHGASAMVAETNAVAVAELLHGCGLWIVIGSNDDRVGTQAAIDFAMAAVARARNKKVKPLVELHVLPANGHTIPDESYITAAKWWLAAIRP